jgi:hypothetical protein
MERLCPQRVADRMTKSDRLVLDTLLAEYPAYAMVDDFGAVGKLLSYELIEANVRHDGEVAQAVYRITARGAEALRLSSGVVALERVS